MYVYHGPELCYPFMFKLCRFMIVFDKLLITHAKHDKRYADKSRDAFSQTKNLPGAPQHHTGLVNKVNDVIYVIH